MTHSAKETSRSGGGVGQIWEREGKQCIRF